jgi:hypothetical protein
MLFFVEISAAANRLAAEKHASRSRDTLDAVTGSLKSSKLGFVLVGVKSRGRIPLELSLEDVDYRVSQLCLILIT